MATILPPYNVQLPEVGGDSDAWGGFLNGNWQIFSTEVQRVEANVTTAQTTADQGVADAAAAQGTADGAAAAAAAAQTTADAAVIRAGDTMTGPLSVGDGTTAAQFGVNGTGVARQDIYEQSGNRGWRWTLGPDGDLDLNTQDAAGVFIANRYTFETGDALSSERAILRRASADGRYPLKTDVGTTLSPSAAWEAWSPVGGTIYNNDKSFFIQVYVRLGAATGNVFEVRSSGAAPWVSVGQGSGSASTMIHAIIPPGHDYRLTGTANAAARLL